MQSKQSIVFFLIGFLLLFFGYSTNVSAELVTHKGLPNREGVKGDPLREKLFNPDLPNRDGIKVEPLKIHTAFATAVQFDTNVFLEDEGEDFDIITILNPSVGAEMEIGDHALAVEYNLTANIFGNHNDHSYVDQRLRAMADINWTDYTITIADIYRRFSDRAGSEDVNHVERQNNYLRAGIAAMFDQLEFDTGYTFGVEDYISKDTIYTTTAGTMTYQDKDRLINVFDAMVGYRFLPKTSILIENYLGFINYDTSASADSWFIETLLGLRGDFSEDLSMNFSVGVRFQDYDDADLTDDNDFIGAVARGGATYNLTEDDVFSLLIERNIYESVFNNMNYYNINHVGLSYTHFFTKKITSRVFGYYQLNLYPSDATLGGVTAKRHDHLYGGGVALRYDINKWASAEIKYEHKERRSKFGTFDFTDELITIRGTAGF